MSAIEQEHPASEWQPGDELYSRSSHPYSLYVFNYRDDSTSDTCSPCNDAARWPEPHSSQRLADTDPIEAFITEWRRSEIRRTIREGLQAAVPWLRLEEA